MHRHCRVWNFTPPPGRVLSVLVELALVASSLSFPPIPFSLFPFPVACLSFCSFVSFSSLPVRTFLSSPAPFFLVSLLLVADIVAWSAGACDSDLLALARSCPALPRLSDIRPLSMFPAFLVTLSLCSFSSPVHVLIPDLAVNETRKTRYPIYPGLSSQIDCIARFRVLTLELLVFPCLLRFLTHLPCP